VALGGARAPREGTTRRRTRRGTSPELAIDASERAWRWRAEEKWWERDGIFQFPRRIFNFIFVSGRSTDPSW
jgi:hypothetical protein